MNLHRDPEGQLVFGEKNNSVDNKLSKTMEISSYESDNSTLRQRIKQLEMQLAASKVTMYHQKHYSACGPLIPVEQWSRRKDERSPTSIGTDQCKLIQELIIMLFFCVQICFTSCQHIRPQFFDP